VERRANYLSKKKKKRAKTKTLGFLLKASSPKRDTHTLRSNYIKGPRRTKKKQIKDEPVNK
jgi:uncharacterized protein YnzC (UPF0291/DUF896 family)